MIYAIEPTTNCLVCQGVGDILRRAEGAGSPSDYLCCAHCAGSGREPTVEVSAFLDTDTSKRRFYKWRRVGDLPFSIVEYETRESALEAARKALGGGR